MSLPIERCSREPLPE
ncbi:hypothetical protein A2U01_0054771, partial [Trifolium medium]|nr:hypothetical protein [Trifolium medium]